MPTLVHDGRPIFESSVILQYLDQVFPEPSLAPPDPYRQAQMRAWLTFVDMVTTPAVRYPSFQFGGLLFKFQAMSDAEFEEKTMRRPVKSAFYRKMDKNTGFSDADMATAYKDIRNTAARMERLFDESGGPWLIGEQYGIADIAVAPLLDRIENLGLEWLWEESHPRVADWLARIQERPAYGRAFYDGSRLSEIYPELPLGRGSHRHVVEQPATVPG